MYRKVEGKGLLGKSRRTWEDSIKVDHKEIWLRVLGWIHLAQDSDQRQLDSCDIVYVHPVALM
jgi:hypothetical protein